MLNQAQYIHQVQQESVQKRPEPFSNGIMQWGHTERGPLLPPYGTRERERALRRLYRHDYNTIFRGAVAGLIKRVQSTPWELSGDDALVDFYQKVLFAADFGTWDQFISKLLVDYSRQDGGAWVELIAPGDPLQPIQTNIIGIAVLDSLRCYPTGNPDFPLIYYNTYGSFHLMHQTRVIQFVDTPDSDEYHLPYGDSALSRCIAPVTRQILMGRYVEQALDDNPPPGIMLLKNIPDQLLQAAVEKWFRERQTDSGGVWGRNIRLHGGIAEVMPEVQFINFSAPPEKFDYEKYTTLDVREIALGIGVDIQDIWELSGGGIGTSTQSEVLAQKSKGKALGRILKGLERVINQALPESLEFTWKYRDPEEDQQTADIAATWSNIITTLDGKLSPDEQRRLLANQVEAIKDVITDDAGHIIRLDDSDPQTPQQQLPAPVVETQTPLQPDAVADDLEASKSITSTRQQLKDAFAQLIQFAGDGVISKGGVRLALRSELQTRGEQAWLDGLQAGGVTEPRLDDTARAYLTAWRTKQTPFVASFVEEITAQPLTTAEIRSRVDTWANMSLDPVYYKALSVANPRGRYMWVYDPLKEHCRTCLRLNGQIHQLKSFTDRNLVPRARSLECGGWKCGCRLVQTDQPIRGRIRSVPYVRNRKHWHHHELN